jgi:hypothetical protein
LSPLFAFGVPFLDLIGDRLAFPTTCHQKLFPLQMIAPSGITAFFGTMMMLSRMK